MNIVFIPAKGKSNEIAEKNLQPVGGIPLVKRTFEFAAASKKIDLIVISTESYKIVNCCVPNKITKKQFDRIGPGQTLHIDKKIILHKRLKKDVSSNSRTIDSILNFLKNYSERDLRESNLILLQPTTPFRIQKELNSLISTFNKSDFDSLVSIKMEDSPHPSKAFQIVDCKINFINKNTLKYLSTPRQELPKFYSIDGGYYILKISKILSSKKIIQRHCGVFLRNGFLSVNIDNIIDLEFARHVESQFSK